MSARPFPIADEVQRHLKGAFDDGVQLGERLGFMQRQRVAYVVGAVWAAVVIGLAIGALDAAGFLSISINP